MRVWDRARDLQPPGDGMSPVPLSQGLALPSSSNPSSQHSSKRYTIIDNRVTDRSWDPALSDSSGSLTCRRTRAAPEQPAPQLPPNRTSHPTGADERLQVEVRFSETQGEKQLMDMRELEDPCTAARWFPCLAGHRSFGDALGYAAGVMSDHFLQEQPPSGPFSSPHCRLLHMGKPLVVTHQQLSEAFERVMLPFPGRPINPVHCWSALCLLRRHPLRTDLHCINPWARPYLEALSQQGPLPRDPSLRVSPLTPLLDPQEPLRVSREGPEDVSHSRERGGSVQRRKASSRCISERDCSASHARRMRRRRRRASKRSYMSVENSSRSDSSSSSSDGDSDSGSGGKGPDPHGEEEAGTNHKIMIRSRKGPEQRPDREGEGPDHRKGDATAHLGPHDPPKPSHALEQMRPIRKESRYYGDRGKGPEGAPLLGSSEGVSPHPLPLLPSLISPQDTSRGAEEEEQGREAGRNAPSPVRMTKSRGGTGECPERSPGVSSPSSSFLAMSFSCMGWTCAINH